MRGIDVSEFVSPIDDLFEMAYESNGQVETIGIGDGGNEIGMGNVMQYTKQFVPNGDVLSTIVRTNLLLICGVSNWGAYAIVSLLAKITGEKKSIVDYETEEKVLESVLKAGGKDGVTGESKMSVDGFPLETVHQEIIQNIEKEIEKFTSVNSRA